MYLVPAYWLLNWLTGSYTLLIILVTLILWSGWAVYSLIRLKTNDEWLAVISVLYYFLLHGRYGAFEADANILTMVCCIVPLFLLCFELKKYALSFVVFILLLFSREDVALWFIFIFIVLAIWHIKEKRVVIYCLAGISLSILYFILLFKVFIPMCETPEKHYLLFQYSALGKNPLETVKYIVAHPIKTFNLLYINPLSNHAFDKVKQEFYLVYLLSGGFLLVLRPQYFIWFIPIIAQKMFNDGVVRWGIHSYEGVPVISILSISVFLILFTFRIKWVRYSLSLLVCLSALLVTRYKLDSHHCELDWGSTIKADIFNPEFFKPKYASKIYNDLKLIPPDAKVCASESILPHLAQRKYIYEFPDVEDAEYLAVFTYRDYYLMDNDAYSKELNPVYF